MPAFDLDTVAAMGAALDEVCQQLPLSSLTMRTHVASRILERAREGEVDLEDLVEAGYLAILNAQ